MRLSLLAASLVVLVACSGSADDDATPPQLREGTVQVMSRDQVPVDVSASAPIKLGKNELSVSFPDVGTELVHVTALMPAHGHGSPDPTIEKTEAGYAVHDVVFYMSGRWEVRFGIRVGDHDDEARAVVDVP